MIRLMLNAVAHARLFVILLGLCLWSSSLQAQFDSNLPKFVPVSPNAASLAKYGEFPVGYHTGTPNISIPIYTVKEGDLQLPITLDYHAGGIKVEEVASWVGLGWSLNAGGAITRSQRGLPDEGDYGFAAMGDSVRKVYEGTLASIDDYRFYAHQELRDLEADVFYFNAGGLSGRFTFTNDGEIMTMPRSDLSIRMSKHGAFYHWSITDGQGNQYLFEQTETSSFEPWSTSSPMYQWNTGNMITQATSWYLTRIISPKKDTISITYQSAGSRFFTKASDSRNVRLICNLLHKDGRVVHQSLQNQRT